MDWYLIALAAIAIYAIIVAILKTYLPTPTGGTIDNAVPPGLSYYVLRADTWHKN